MAGMKTLLRVAIVVAAMLAPALTHAQVKQPIYVAECKAQDSDVVGRGLCSGLRDALAKSPRYALLTGPGKEFHYVVLVSSTPIAGSASASSVVFGFAVGEGEMRFLGHQVLATGNHQIDGQVADLLGDLDALMDAVKKATP